jgi:hypothetical protein
LEAAITQNSLLCQYSRWRRGTLTKNDEHFKYLGKGAQFLAKAKELLLREMTEGKPKIPTIQELLILGGRQSTVGRSSEGKDSYQNDNGYRAASGYAEACGI